MFGKKKCKKKKRVEQSSIPGIELLETPFCHDGMTWAPKDGPPSHGELPKTPGLRA